MIQIFCKQQGYSFGSVLRIGSGEAILNTPLKWFVIRNIKRLAASISEGRGENLKVTMPLPKKNVCAGVYNLLVELWEKERNYAGTDGNYGN